MTLSLRQITAIYFENPEVSQTGRGQVFIPSFQAFRYGLQEVSFPR
jgi:hypothetical protein